MTSESSPLDETTLKPPAKKRQKLSPLAKTILKNASLRATHCKALRELGINLDLVMPDNTKGLRVELFAYHVLENPALTVEEFPEALKVEFGEKARTVAILINNFIVDKIRLRHLPKPRKEKDKEKESKQAIKEVLEETLDDCYAEEIEEEEVA
ncbi:MAG: hypothetical protein M0R80_01195 [Proteobacteria bacterium]|jgi:hypothetical protein|nr:hypothetical protein [Pseudomonadota bacterium]